MRRTECRRVSEGAHRRKKARCDIGLSVTFGAAPRTIRVKND